MTIETEVKKVRVTFATICSVCESVISENTSELTEAEIEERKGRPDFFEYHDKHNNSLFRSLIQEDSCRYC